MMSKTSDPARSKAAKWGWGMLLAVGAMLVVDGLALYLAGAGHEPHTAILLTALGVQALIVSLAGLRQGQRWAWRAAWVLVATPAAIGAQVMAGEAATTVGAWYLFLAAAALVGQVLAGGEDAEGREEQ